MKRRSIWSDYIIKGNNSINKNFETDILIIGGGITGLSTLYQLKKNKLNAILVESNKCGSGVTSKSTAKITYLQEQIYMKIRKYQSKEIAKKYLNSQCDAVVILKDIIKKENIDCDLKKVASYIFTNNKNKFDILNEEYNFLLNLGVKAKFGNDNEIDSKYYIKVNDTYQFNPIKYINSLKDMFKNSIYENSRVNNITRKDDLYYCQINGYTVKTKYVVMATHYPYFLFPTLLPFKSHIEVSYVGAIKTNNVKDICAINIDKPCISYRYYSDNDNNYLIYLYNSYIGCNIKNIKDNFDNLLKGQKFDYIWSNKDIITSDYIPYVGRVYKNNNNFLIACGYNTWGMTNATIASIVLKDIILNKKNKYTSLFDPNRRINLSKLIRFPIDLSSNIKAYIKGIKSNINNQDIRYEIIDGCNVAIYKDEKGIEHKVLNTCPHMKCGLVFNKVEKTWDCLCHGSKFDIDGKCIEGPSNLDIGFKR